MNQIVSRGGKWGRLLSKQSSVIVLVLIFVLIFRGLSLEHVSLIDPTETRYASIAQEMVLTGDWVTPRLPTVRGLELYMSKPPLHYWLTAASFELFGVKAWTSRLPSYFALLLMVAAVMVFAAKFWQSRIGYSAGVICATSPLLFYLAGSSTVDVTFAAFVSAALTAFAFSAASQTRTLQNSFAGWLFFIFSALAFLTKGPSAIILIGMPMLALCVFDRSLSVLRSLPWIVGSVLFFAITVPWFYLVEQANPGSVWYYFVHENFFRFLVKEYGGNHGAAHIQPYGFIWLMLLLSIFPWSLFLFREMFFRKKKDAPAMDRWLFFCLAWGLSPMLFFTFSRSILPAYVLPGIPGLALCLGYLVNRSSQTKTAPLAGELSPTSRGFWIRFKLQEPYLARIGFGMGLVMSAIILFLGPMAGPRKSSKQILEVIALEAQTENLKVGAVSTNNYSPFWIARASKEELSQTVSVAYVSPENVTAAKHQHLVVRDKGKPDFLEKNGASYDKVTSRGHWTWYRRKPKRIGQSAGATATLIRTKPFILSAEEH